MYLTEAAHNTRMNLNEYFSNLIDVYLLHILFKNNYLTPLLFTNHNLAPVANGENLNVPIELYWIFKMKYGKLYNVRSLVRPDPSHLPVEFSDKTVKFRMRRKKQKACIDRGVDVDIRWRDASPVVISGAFPMRFR